MSCEFDFSSIISSRVLVQLSGGKDSIACLEKMCEHNIKCEAIHFVHEYSYSLPTSEAKRICKERDISLHIVDINTEIKNLFLDDFRLRPCRYCKGIMDQQTVDFAKLNNFDFICVGDSKDDTMLVNRLHNLGEQNLFVTKYFNKSVSLPENIYILRPLVYMAGNEVMAYLKGRNVVVQRVGDTGDKYFEYSREGCPLQFKDFGVPYNEELMRNLREYNLHCANFANQNGVRASIHLPSEFIVTIPRGYEVSCRNYLISHGCNLKDNKVLSKEIKHHYSIHSNIGAELTDLSLLDIAIQRFLEREELGAKLQSSFSNECLFYAFEQGEMHVYADTMNKKITLELYLNKRLKPEHIKDVFSEIFHQHNTEVHEIGRKLNILVFNNNFMGSYGSNQVFYQELCQAIHEQGNNLYCATSFAEGEEIVKSIDIDFSISFGQYKIQEENIKFYDKYAIPHYQWVSDNPFKMNIDSESPYIHYIFIDDDFPLHTKKLVNRPLFLPLGCIGPVGSKYSSDNKIDAILFPAQIRDIGAIKDEIEHSPYREMILNFLKEVDYDDSYIVQLNKFARNNFTEEEIPLEFFSLTNSYLRTNKRIMTVSSITGKKVVVVGQKPEIKFPDACDIEFLGKVEYVNIEKMMAQYRYVLNVDPNYYSCFHDRFVRAINAGSICITNENRKISSQTGFSACYRFSELDSLPHLLTVLQENYFDILQEQQAFIRGLNWRSSVLNIMQHFLESSKELIRKSIHKIDLENR